MRVLDFLLSFAFSLESSNEQIISWKTEIGGWISAGVGFNESGSLDVTVVLYLRNEGRKGDRPFDIPFNRSKVIV